jgi:indolepyruvate ferredoxin oxidoreductase beta subunit
MQRARFSRRVVAFDMEEAAREAGTAMSAVMFGAIAGSGVLPLERAVCEAVINEGERGARASLAGFALGIAAVRRDAESRRVAARDARDDRARLAIASSISRMPRTAICTSSASPRARPRNGRAIPAHRTTLR